MGAGRGVLARAAHRVPGSSAPACGDAVGACLSGEPDDATMRTLGARLVGPGTAVEILRTWLETAGGGGRRTRRLEKIAGREQRIAGPDGGCP